MSEEPRSPPWSITTKVFVAAITFILLGLVIWRFNNLIAPLIIAGIIAYFLDPIIVWLERSTHLSRGAAIALVYPLVALLVLGGLVAAGLTIFRQAFGLLEVVQEVIWYGPEYVDTWLREPLIIGPWTIDPLQLNLDVYQIIQQLTAAIQPLMSQSAQFVGLAASATVGWIGWVILIFVLSIYFALDLPRFYGLISQAIHQPGYRRDAERLMNDAGRIWHGYLRGQTTLAVIVAISFTIVLNLLGVRYAIALGLLAGILDFIPYFGPIAIVTLSTMVAVFQGSNWLGLSPIWFGMVVLLAGLIIQQVEGNWLNPRIMGGALGLHPMVVMIGALMGSTLAGLLGIVLAAPVLATLKLLGTYAWRKMFDLDPFPETEPEQVPERTPPEKTNLTLKPGKKGGRLPFGRNLLSWFTKR